jgi:hypothetical protein
MNCVNCDSEFIEQRGAAYRCSTCGWLTQVDGKWCSCPEPPLVPEPKMSVPDVPASAEPVPEPEPAEQLSDSQPTRDRLDHKPQPTVHEYLGGLVTVTEIDDGEEEEEN